MVSDLTLAGGARAVARCDALGVQPFSSEPGNLTRTYLTPAHKAALEQLAEWMEQAGMAVRMDPAANLVGRYEGTEEGAPALVIASHIDSVRDAGRYDGPLGVMLGVECVAALDAAGERMPFPIEVVAFGDEEGSRFPTAMLTSRAMAGTAPDDALDLVDRDGVSVGTAMAEFGLDPQRFFSAARPKGSVFAYLEAHIEQGPVLEAEDLPVGMVTGIAAQLRYEIALTGFAAHAGTAAMNLRKDALAAAAECVLAAEAVGRGVPPDLVATVGKMQVLPGAPNVVPGEVRFSLDVRAGDQATRDRAAERILEAFDGIAQARSIGIAVEKRLDLPASPSDPDLSEVLIQSIAGCGLYPRRLVSGAGHDAMIMADLCPTAMLFIRCAGGVSHNPAESVMPEDCEEALRVMLEFIHRLGARYGA